MEKKHKKANKTAQDIQDDIFRKMSADQKIKLGAQLWQLAKSLANDKINYAGKRSKKRNPAGIWKTPNQS